MRALGALLTLALLVPGSAAAAKAKKTPPPPRVLVYAGTAGYHHASIETGDDTLAYLARMSRRFTVQVITNPADLTPARLAASDIVLWNSTTGANSPFSDAQEKAYMSWVGCGGGHMGVHASIDSYKDWPGWAELTGAFFKIHPITPTSIADDATPEHQGWGEPEATILVKDQTSAITAAWHGRNSFLLHDEFYALDRDPSKMRDFHLVLAFGGFRDPLVAALYGSMYAREQPLAWTASYRGLNRISYTNLGHSPTTWHRPDFQDSLIEAITWTSARRPSRTCLRAAKVAR